MTGAGGGQGGASTVQLKTPVNRVSQSLTSLIALLLGDGGCHPWLLFNSAPSQPGFKYKFFFFLSDFGRNCDFV